MAGVNSVIPPNIIAVNGIVGKKIHTARSRNDQVLTALRLYEKEELKNIIELNKKFKLTLNKAIFKLSEYKRPITCTK